MTNVKEREAILKATLQAVKAGVVSVREGVQVLSPLLSAQPAPAPVLGTPPAPVPVRGVAHDGPAGVVLRARLRGWWVRQLDGQGWVQVAGRAGALRKVKGAERSVAREVLMELAAEGVVEEVGGRVRLVCSPVLVPRLAG